jgi:hypothetical protein
MQTAYKYRPVIFAAGGEQGVCGGRDFDARRTGDGFDVFEQDEFRFRAANLGEIRDGIEALVNS